MEKEFRVGIIKIEKLTKERVQEVIDLIYNVYQHDHIWVDYPKSAVALEVKSAFDDTCYKPVFFIALHEEKIIGVASYMESHISSEAFELSFATILPEYQRNGIGTWLTYIRLKEIRSREKDAFVITRARAPKIFEGFNFTYIHKTIDAHGTKGSYDYMYCLAKDFDFGKFE